MCHSVTIVVFRSPKLKTTDIGPIHPHPLRKFSLR